MAGRKARKEKENQARQPGQEPTLYDALAATHEHTVPVLPAFEGQETNTRVRRSPARAGKASANTRAAKTAGADDSGRILLSRSESLDTPTRDEIEQAETAIQPVDRRTLVLPMLSDEQRAERATDRALVVAPGDDARAVALRSEPESRAVFIRGAKRAPRLPMTVVPRRKGPPSFVAQFAVALVAVMTLFSAFTIASPLGHSAAFSGTYQAYANAAPWIPTPTPTDTPTPTPVPYVAPASSGPAPGANPGQQAIMNDITAVFGPYAQGALAVARCESGYDPNAWNPYAIGGSHAAGVFQILYPSTWSGTSYAGSSPFNSSANIRAAYQIFARDGYRWSEWQCQP